jgi:hypothetical protein
VKKEIDYEKIPYFDVKVVKVKKEDKCEHFLLTYITKLDRYRCNKCGAIGFWNNKGFIVNKEEGNFVNGENLDKIKFPCWCSYLDGMRVKHYGELDQTTSGCYKIRILEQAKNNLYTYIKCNLKELIETYKVKILKGKVVLFEKEEGK